MCTIQVLSEAWCIQIFKKCCGRKTAFAWIVCELSIVWSFNFKCFYVFTTTSKVSGFPENKVWSSIIGLLWHWNCNQWLPETTNVIYFFWGIVIAVCFQNTVDVVHAQHCGYDSCYQFLNLALFFVLFLADVCEAYPSNLNTCLKSLHSFSDWLGDVQHYVHFF